MLQGPPKIKIYRSYKKFELENFNKILKDKLENLTNHSYAGVCVPRPSVLLLIQDYTYSRLKHYTYSRYSKSYLERISYGVQNKWKGFSSQYFF